MRVLCASAIILLAACGDAPASDTPAPVVPAATSDTARGPAPYFVLGPRARSIHLGDLIPADSTARRTWMRARMDIVRSQFELSETIQRVSDWREADALVRDSVEAGALWSHDYAIKMLDHHLLRGPLDDAKAEALGFYTRRLMDLRSEEGAVLLWALIRLEGRWEEPERQRMAQGAADNLGAAYARIAGCVDCTIDEALARMWPQRRKTSESTLHDMAEVHRELVRIARGDMPMPG